MPIRTLRFPYRHRGQGIGSLLSKIGYFVKPLLRSAVKVTKPIAKQVAKDLANQGLQAATSTIGEIISGTDPKEAIRSNAKAGFKRAQSTVKAGTKRALNETARGTVKAIKRRRQTQTGGRKKQKKKVTKKGRKKTAKRKPYKGIFQ